MARGIRKDGRPTALRRPFTWQAESTPRYSHLSSCWNCSSHLCDEQGRPKAQGYRKGKPMRVATLIFEECFGFVPEGRVIRHRCDNTKCINPEHLELGTQLDNIRDMEARNRADRRGQLKLSDRQVGMIRSLYAKYPKTNGKCLAYIFNVSEPTISEIKNNRKRISVS